MTCRIEVAEGRVRLRHGLLRGQVVRPAGGMTRIGLLATSALLLGGDSVEIEVSVGAGERLALFDVAGTVAYHGRGAGAAWHVRIDVARNGRLEWAGEPFVVADGADVDRSLTVALASGASLRLRETLVLGRTGEVGGRIRNRTSIVRAGEPVFLEDQRLDPITRALPGILGSHRVIDSLLDMPAPATTLEGPTSFLLPFGVGRLTRWVGHSAADSALAMVAPR